MEVRVLHLAQNQLYMAQQVKVNVLENVEPILGVSFGHIQESHELATNKEIQLLKLFFKVNYLELIILIQLIESGVHQDQLNLDQIMEHFGGSVANLKPILSAIDSLVVKGYVYSTTTNRFSATKINQTFHVEDKVFEAILSDNPIKLLTKPATNFVEFMQRIEVFLKKREMGQFDAKTLSKLMLHELAITKGIKEITWIKSFKKLTDFDRSLLLYLIGHTFKAPRSFSLEYTIKELEDIFMSQKQQRDYLMLGESILIKEQLVTVEEDSAYEEYISLSAKSMEKLFAITASDRKKLNFEMGTVISPETITPEILHYNDSESKQIQTIEQVLHPEKYTMVVNHLHQNGLGKGITILFNGASGTGKTATAKQIAKSTQRPIYSVDVEKVINKWVGDSEKNVKKIFEEYAAFSSQSESVPILFFNEDSIFSKRVEVSHSTDRSHNSIQNILLEQLESFAGIAIITSNHADKLDNAFERRFLYKVEFQKPNTLTQKNIIMQQFQDLSSALIDSVLEHYSFTGGQIFNIRKKYVLQNILLENTTNEALFLSLCKEETQKNTSNKIGF